MTVRLGDELLASVKASYPKETLRQPLRVIVDSQNRLDPGPAPVPERGPGAAGSSQGRRGLACLGSNWSCRCWMVSWSISLFMLLAKQKINSVLVEAGPRPCGAPLEKGLVDQLALGIRRAQTDGDEYSRRFIKISVFIGENINSLVFSYWCS